MKKSITGAVMLLAGAAIVHAQGQVSFANYFSSGNYVTVEYNGHAVGGSAAHTGTSADTADGADWSVQLYGAPGTGVALSSLVPAVLDGTTSTAVTATLAGVGAPYLGQWNSGAIGDIPGAAVGTPATVAVAAWYNDGGTITSITAAQAAGFANGFSATGNVTTGGAPNLPAALPVLGNGIINTAGNVGSVTPEPSTIALGVMGASAFFMRMRKK
jgi:hypothetical protein